MHDTRASRTAIIVAAQRALHQLHDDRPLILDDPVAVPILGPELLARFDKKRTLFDRFRIARYRRSFFVARSRYAEDRLADAVTKGVKQYVIVGAGFDTFAYRNPHEHVRVFEVDHPATQRFKRKRLADAAIRMPNNVTYVAADLSTTSLTTALDQAGFDAAEPAVFAWLGVTMYLELPAIEAVLRYVAERPRGSEIVFDYITRPESFGTIGRWFFRRRAKQVAKLGEPWITFFDPGDLRALLLRTGFKTIEDLGAEELNARYFANRRDRLWVAPAVRVASVRVT